MVARRRSAENIGMRGDKEKEREYGLFLGILELCEEKKREREREREWRDEEVKAPTPSAPPTPWWTSWGNEETEGQHAAR